MPASAAEPGSEGAAPAGPPNQPDQPGSIEPREYLRMVLAGAAIGIPAALLASGFLALVHGLEHWLWHDLPESMGLHEPPWYFLLLLPVIGALIVAAARRLLPGNGGHEPLEGLSMAPTPIRYAPGIALAALGTLAFGAVLGPEAPLVALGSAVGMAFVPLLKGAKHADRVLATAGSFAAIAALFGGPLVGGVLLLEGGLAAGAALIPLLLPGVTAAAIGYVIFTGVGDWGGLSATPLTVPGLPAYDGTRILDLLLAIVVGVLASLVITWIKGLARRLSPEDPAPGRLTAGLVLGGLLVGVLALVARLLGADSQDVLFSGQASMPNLVAETSIWILLLLLVTKGLAYALSLGLGFRGGAIFPAIFIGVVLAMMLSVALDCSPTWALVVGAATGMAAGSGMVFSSLLLAMLLAGSTGQDALPAAVLGVVAAWLTSAALTRRSAVSAPQAVAEPS